MYQRHLLDYNIDGMRPFPSHLLELRRGQERYNKTEKRNHLNPFILAPWSEAFFPLISNPSVSSLFENRLSEIVTDHQK